MKKSLIAAAMCSTLVLSLGAGTAGAQESVTVSAAENTNLYFVELAGSPTADGSGMDRVKAEKSAFRKAATAAGVKFKERRSFDVLFNGFSVEIDKTNREKLALVPGFKALWPVEHIQAPELSPGGGAAPDLATAIAMTGADVVQNTLGITGKGIKVAVMDTGIDYDNADLGGDGVQRSNSTAFPTSRVITGWDFVGDAFVGDNALVPDPYPDDCNGHGSHVSGIIGAKGEVTGVAPDVVFGAYRVFGCDGSTTADIMLAAMERAFADGMDVLNMSIGSRTQWPEYPTAVGASRLVKKGMVVVASIGNNGPGGSAPDGTYAAGAPGVGKDVIGVASYDNTRVTQPAFTVSPDNAPIGYTAASGAPTAPVSGSLPMSKTGTTTTTNDGCNPLAAGSLTGTAALIRRGACTFFTKAINAQNAGAAAVVLYNNAAGFVSPTVAGTPAITIPVVAITAADGATLDGRIAAGATTLTWTDQLTSVVNPTGGLISGFSSFGMAADLSLKPDIGAPGGSIFSTVPIEQGGHGNNSGTSMSSPHVAGAAALLLAANADDKGKHGKGKGKDEDDDDDDDDKRGINARDVRARLQNSAAPSLWSGNPGLGFLEHTHRQGAGLLDIEAAILATVEVEPGKLSLGESEAGPQAKTLKIRNRGNSTVTFDLSHVAALATGPKSMTNFAAVSVFNSPAAVVFSAPNVTIPRGESRTVDVTITAPVAPALGQYGGFLVLTPQGSGQTYRVPYAGFIGDYQAVPVLTPTANGFPWLAQIVGPDFVNRPAGATYTLVGDDIPFFLIHLDHQSRRIRLEAFDANTGQSFHRVSNDEFVGRNTSAAGFFAFSWDGVTFKGKGTKPEQFSAVPNGQYVVRVTVLKALGDDDNPAHQETWTSPVITIARP